jgi:hypothetical protein
MCGANVGNAGQLRTAKAGAIEEASSQASEPLVLLPDTGLHGISRNLTEPHQICEKTMNYKEN